MTSPRCGDFLVTTMPGEVGEAVRLGQFLLRGNRRTARWAHAGIVTHVYPDGRVQAIAEFPGGASRAVYEQRHCMFSTVPLTGAQRRAIVVYANIQAGRRTPYSFADYAALAAHRFRLPGSGALKDFVADSGHMICSQLVDRCYQLAGVQLFDDGRWPGYVIPSDLAELCG